MALGSGVSPFPPPPAPPEPPRMWQVLDPPLATCRFGVVRLQYSIAHWGDKASDEEIAKFEEAGHAMLPGSVERGLLAEPGRYTEVTVLSNEVRRTLRIVYCAFEDDPLTRN